MTPAAHETRGSSAADLEQGVGRDPVESQGEKVKTRRSGEENEGSHGEAALGRLEPSRGFTRHQLFYVFVLDGIGGMLVSGGVNFALAYVMYTSQDTTKHPIRLFQLPNTLAGDAAVTIIVQCILTWFVEKGLVAYDLSRRAVQPMGFLPEPTISWQRKLFFLQPPANPAETVVAPRAAILAGLLQQALRGFLLAVVGFVVLWPASVGILTALGTREGGDYVYEERWTPQVFKLVLGGLLGLLTTPLMAMFWLVKAGWEGDVHREPSS